jgi:phospholipid-transporting ATPase
LLLVHGQWSYRRMCKLVLYSFWKNMLFAITNICFGFYSAFSAQVPPHLRPSLCPVSPSAR